MGYGEGDFSVRRLPNESNEMSQKETVQIVSRDVSSLKMAPHHPLCVIRRGVVTTVSACSKTLNVSMTHYGKLGVVQGSPGSRAPRCSRTPRSKTSKAGED